MRNLQPQRTCRPAAKDGSRQGIFLIKYEYYRPHRKVARNVCVKLTQDENPQSVYDSLHWTNNLLTEFSRSDASRQVQT